MPGIKQKRVIILHQKLNPNFKYIKGNPKIRITYDPRLDYSIGRLNHSKSNFIVSISENENYETLYLYSNASLNQLLIMKLLN
ncbi:MAG: hypothetical protein CM15mP102_05560 [Flavobacteriales bacterium]|nr:MAG: hypothetical protein CM15mP102_05560 [Flavobacteriales bacterium]